MKGVAARYVPDGSVHRAELRPALLRLGWPWEIHSAENWKQQTHISFGVTPVTLHASVLLPAWESHKRTSSQVERIVGSKSREWVGRVVVGSIDGANWTPHSRAITQTQIFSPFCILASCLAVSLVFCSYTCQSCRFPPMSCAPDFFLGCQFYLGQNHLTQKDKTLLLSSYRSSHKPHIQVPLFPRLPGLLS